MPGDNFEDLLKQRKEEARIKREAAAAATSTSDERARRRVIDLNTMRLQVAGPLQNAAVRFQTALRDIAEIQFTGTAQDNLMRCSFTYRKTAGNGTIASASLNFGQKDGGVIAVVSSLTSIPPTELKLGETKPDAIDALVQTFLTEALR